MFYGSQVQETRQLFYSSWKKYLDKQRLQPLEKQIVQVILDHPEYHSLLGTPTTSEQSFFPEMGETNPFLHMGLHLAIRDQIKTNRPKGIESIYTELLHQHNDALDVEHVLMEELAECLWQAQRSQSMPNDVSYLNACRKRLSQFTDK